jgi:hypothetical protein
LAPLAVVAALLCAAAPAAAARPWSPDMRAARAYVAHRSGHVSFAVRTPHRFYGHAAYRTARSASVVKAMLMVAYLDRRGVRGRALHRRDHALLTPMITRSDNDAASRVRDIVGNGALRALARRVGMRRFATAPSWGSTQITAGDQARFFLHLERYVVARHRDTALHLLGSISRPQRWGVGRVRPRGWALYFKGGWGSGTGLVDHQVALLRRGRRRLSLAILTTDNPSHAYGKRTLRGVAARLLRGLRPDSVPR